MTSDSPLESASARPGRTTVDLGLNIQHFSGHSDRLTQVTETNEESEDGSSSSVITCNQQDEERTSFLADLQNSAGWALDDQSIPSTHLKVDKQRRKSAPNVAKLAEDTLYPDFLLDKQYPSASKFDKCIRPNPEMDLVMRWQLSGASTLSSTRSLNLTQVQKNFYFSNVSDILKDALQKWFEQLNDTVVSLIAECVSLIMEYCQDKRVSFSKDAPEYYKVDPMGSEHRVVIKPYRPLQKRTSLEKGEFSPAEKKEARETAANIDFLVEFPDAYQ